MMGTHRSEVLTNECFHTVHFDEDVLGFHVYVKTQNM